MFRPMSSLSRAELFQILEGRIADPSCAEAIDAEVRVRHHAVR
jgi:hypothetical protein